MESPSLTRPPRPRRPPEVVRHVDQLMDAYRRVRAGGKRAAPPSETRPDKPGR